MATQTENPTNLDAEVGEGHVEAPFDDHEKAILAADDAQASRAIGKMLSLFFLYTVIVMAMSLWVTIRWING